jgi:SEC-C motif-containing protein
MKRSVNSPCPCGSQIKYKKCCQRYHKGANAKDALTLMKSRYSAYLFGDASYIIKTTDPENPDYHDNHQVWQESIKAFSQENHFKNLIIEAYEEQGEEAYVTFRAIFEDGELYERSRFVKKEGIWLYREGEIKNS